MVTTAISPAPGEPEPVAKIGAFGRVTGVLFSPGETYKDIVQKPNWFLPLAILTVLSLIVCYFLVQKVDWEAFQRKQIESSSFTSNLTQDQKDQAVARNLKMTTPLTYGIGILGPIISILIFTLIYWGSFNVFKGAGLRFGTSFAITCYALLPASIGAILTLIILILKRAGEVDPQRIAATSLGFFLAADAPKWLVALGSSLDLLWFWTLALLAIGYAAANPKKITTSSAYSVVIGMWLVWVVLKLGFAAMF
jgi:Yip1 domain